MSIVIMSQGKDVNPWVKALKELRPELELSVYPEVANKEKVEFALTWNHPAGVFKEFPHIKCISSMGAGVDHIFKDPELPAQAIVTRIIDENLSKDMAEFCIALVMNHIRGLSFYKRVQAQQQWVPQPYLTIEGVKIGIMGMGVLGAHVAGELHKLGFQVSGWARTSKAIEGIKVYSGNEELSSFLAQSDILICLLPLTKETENILNINTLSQLPQHAFVINVARGKHLVEEDLIAMLDNGHLSGASLDVFRQEPLPEDHPFWQHPKINVTPHIASVTKPSSVVAQVLANYDRLKNNQPLHNIVSALKGY